jgi:hypothetical protein
MDELAGTAVENARVDKSPVIKTRLENRQAAVRPRALALLGFSHYYRVYHDDREVLGIVVDDWRRAFGGLGRGRSRRGSSFGLEGWLLNCALLCRRAIETIAP